MYLLTLLATTFTLTSSVLVAAQGLDNDHNSRCAPACGPVVRATNVCENRVGDDDEARLLHCICTKNNQMERSITHCEQCYINYINSQNPNDVDDDDRDYLEDVRELRQSCGFSAPSSTVTSSVVSSSVTVITTTSTDDDGEVETETETSTLLFLATPTNGGGNSNGNNNAQNTGSGNLAAATAAPVLGAGAVAILAGVAAAV